MNRVAVFMCIYLVKSCNSHKGLSEGAGCIVDGALGVCTNIADCSSAVEDLRKGKFPTTCSFEGLEPIVCCFNKDVTTTMATSPAPPQRSDTTTTVAVEDTDFKLLDKDGEETTTTTVETEGCPPLSPNKTAAKTGQKAWDKCIEYQEQLIFPCNASQRKRLNNCRSDLNTWILGGEDAFEGEFPHMALVGYGTDPQKLSFLCGGSLISDRFVLTAGHCMTSRNLGPISYVLLGVLKRTDFDQSHLHKIQTVHKHPDYTPPFKYNDIALLQLELPIILSGLTVPACLDVGGMPEHTVATATGWGVVEYAGRSSDMLQKVDLNKFQDAECAARYPATRHMRNGFDNSSQICYGDKKMSKDTCQGDSGGPLQVRHGKIYCMFAVIGVTSFGRACGVPGQPAVYTRVAHYVSWIESVVWPDTASTAPPATSTRAARA